MENVHRRRWQYYHEGVEKMNDYLLKTLKARYEAEIQDAKYKINAIEEHNMVIRCCVRFHLLKISWQ